MSNVTKILVYSALVVFLLVLFLLNLGYGSVSLSWNEIIHSLFSIDNDKSSAEIIILQYRLPQAITAMGIGIGLSVAGLLLQTTFNNPLAGPSVLGISAGASLGVAFLVMFGGMAGFQIGDVSFVVSDVSMMIAATLGALSVLLVIVFVSGKIGNAVTVLIIGIMIGYLVSAVVGTLQFFSSSEDLHSFVLWGLGSFSTTSIHQSLFILITTVIISLVVLFFVKPLNALLLGYRYAITSGYNVVALQTLFILISGLLIALGTAFTGPIAFIGLAVPHIARNISKTSNHSTLLPLTILAGAGLSLLCNFLSKMPGYDTSLPINAVTSIVGAPIVIWVIIKGRRISHA